MVAVVCIYFASEPSCPKRGRFFAKGSVATGITLQRRRLCNLLYGRFLRNIICAPLTVGTSCRCVWLLSSSSSSSSSPTTLNHPPTSSLPLSSPRPHQSSRLHRGRPGPNGCLGYKRRWNPTQLCGHGFTNWLVVADFFFTPTWGSDPIWLVCFKWVDSTN